MPRSEYFTKWFKPQKWKWYIVDLTDYHKPVLIRKHLDTKPQAKEFKAKYYEGSEYKIVDWETVKEYNLDHGPKTRRGKHHTAKYNYPENCITQYQRQLFRNKERNKLMTDKRRPKPSLKALDKIFEDNHIEALKGLRNYRTNSWVFITPIRGLTELRKLYRYPRELRYLSNIVRFLKDNYDIGRYDIIKLAIFIWDEYRANVIINNRPKKNMAISEENVENELIARGFVYYEDEWDFILRPGMVISDNIKHKMVYSGMAQPTIDDDPLIELIGIKGWTKVHQENVK